MKPMIKPVEFISPLSEVEVRMTLRELCGSKWDNDPFCGEIDRNSFRLIKNSLGYSRGLQKSTLVGTFVEQNGKTKVSISLKPRMIESIGIGIFVLVAFFCAIFCFISTLDENFILAIISAITVATFGVGILALNYFLIWSSFQRSVAKIKQALGNIS